MTIEERHLSDSTEIAHRLLNTLLDKPASHPALVTAAGLVFISLIDSIPEPWPPSLSRVRDAIDTMLTHSASPSTKFPPSPSPTTTWSKASRSIPTESGNGLFHSRHKPRYNTGCRRARIQVCRPPERSEHPGRSGPVAALFSFPAGLWKKPLRPRIRGR
jgi:hypothetical protein